MCFQTKFLLKYSYTHSSLEEIFWTSLRRQNATPTSKMNHTNILLHNDWAWNYPSIYSLYADTDSLWFSVAWGKNTILCSLILTTYCTYPIYSMLLTMACCSGLEIVIFERRCIVKFSFLEFTLFEYHMHGIIRLNYCFFFCPTYHLTDMPCRRRHTNIFCVILDDFSYHVLFVCRQFVYWKVFIKRFFIILTNVSYDK